MTWQSLLQLHFDYVTTANKTRLSHRAHQGALMVQRALYPEPDTQSGICHIYVLYPPAGIADDDRLNLEFELKANSHAVITTPGAGKWYGQRESVRPIKSRGALASSLSQAASSDVITEATTTSASHFQDHLLKTNPNQPSKQATTKQTNHNQKSDNQDSQTASNSQNQQTQNDQTQNNQSSANQTANNSQNQPLTAHSQHASSKANIEPSHHANSNNAIDTQNAIQDNLHNHSAPTEPTTAPNTDHRLTPRQANLFSEKVTAEQHINARLDDHAILEWLPQESIYYDHSVSHANNRFYLAKTASLLTWDIAVFGRQAYQETFANGHYANRLEIWRDDRLLVSEHTSQQADSRWFNSALGLNGQHVHGSFWAIPSTDIIDSVAQENPLKLGQYLDDTLTELRQLIDDKGLPIECTHNYQGINCRYLGTHVRACFEAFYQVRELIRLKWYALEPHRPRIWDT